MPELLVAPNMVDLIPTIVLQPPDHLAAVHKLGYTLNTHLSMEFEQGLPGSPLTGFIEPPKKGTRRVGAFLCSNFEVETDQQLPVLLSPAVAEAAARLPRAVRPFRILRLAPV
jgi:hypothetical protein